ncbi:MAG: glycosyltransferase family 2 protein [Luteibaculum sp.]
MLSVLIPNYNYHPGELLKQLSAESEGLDIPVEILCWDDNSDPSFHRELIALSSLPKVELRFLEKNLGRAQIRNQMAQEARFPHLLFLDSDGMPLHPDFLARYAEHLAAADVVVGGRKYSATKPESAHILHWKYGSQREAKWADERNEDPYFGFQSNNFLIQKESFLSLQFPQSFKGSGHEDTLFGKKLKQRNLSVTHINNQTEHRGLEIAEVFIQKSLQAVEQLVKFIYHQELEHKDTRLSDSYWRLKKLGLLAGVKFVGKNRSKSWMEQLKNASDPNLKIFDALRLYHYICETEKLH